MVIGVCKLRMVTCIDRDNQCNSGVKSTTKSYLRGYRELHYFEGYYIGWTRDAPPSLSTTKTCKPWALKEGGEVGGSIKGGG